MGKWKPLKDSEWRTFKKEKLKKWVKPVSLPLSNYEQVDIRYTEFMQQNRLIAEMQAEAGERVEQWRLAENLERKAGWRGQHWFSELLRDLKISHIAEHKDETPFDGRWLEIKDKLFDLDFKLRDWIKLKYALEIKPDITIWELGTIEVKTSLNVKEYSWSINPSLYLVVLQKCGEAMLEFQFLGWLYGHEVYNLQVEPENFPVYPKAHYLIETLKDPKEFLEKALEVSKANPKRARREG